MARTRQLRAVLSPTLTLPQRTGEGIRRKPCKKIRRARSKSREGRLDGRIQLEAQALDWLTCRSSPLPDLLAWHFACHRCLLPRFQHPPRADLTDVRRGPADAGRVLDAYS